MNNLFDLDHQNLHLSEKIVAGLERLATLGRSLLWQEAQAQKVSPIQFQVLAFLYGHGHLSVTLTLLAKEFGITKATVSDAVRSLEQKKLIVRMPDAADARVQYLSLTDAGREMVRQSADYLSPVVQAIGAQAAADLAGTWKVLSAAIYTLMQQRVIPMQRMCFACRHYSWNGREHYCALLRLVLHDAQIRIDCPEHEPAPAAV